MNFIKAGGVKDLLRLTPPYLLFRKRSAQRPYVTVIFQADQAKPLLK